jgi:hypothetical protein
MNPRLGAIAAHVAAAAKVVGLEIADDHLPGVESFVALAAGMAATLEAVPLDPDDDALAPVFRLPAPEPPR